MGNLNIKVDLRNVDLASLTTEEEIRAQAKQLVPEALRHIGEASAEHQWKETQKIFDGPGFSPDHSSADRRTFITDAGRQYAREANAKEKQLIENHIVEQLKAGKQQGELRPQPPTRSDTVVFDIKQHEQDKLSFLEALYAIIQEQLEHDPRALEPVRIGVGEAEIGKRAGFTSQQTTRINSDLEHDGMTRFRGASQAGGRSTCLTREGLHFIERHLYDRAQAGAEEQEQPAEPSVSASQVQEAIREFDELASDLMGSDSSTFSGHFKHFYEFVDSDEVMRVVTTDLRNHPAVDIDRWLEEFEASGGSMMGSHEYALPRDKSARAATLFQLFCKIREGDTDPENFVLNFAADAYGTSHFDECIYKFNENITKKLVRILEQRLNALFQQAAQAQHAATPGAQPAMATNRVFIVHGHDEAAKQTVARFVEKLDLEAIILHERPNQGRTIIEKFEHHADVGFAIILLTPDDVGASKADHQQKKPLNARARQNVVFEHGYFVGKLGRSRVCALYKGVEIPSDLLGVLYLEMDNQEAWQVELVREMRAAGLNVDVSKMF